MKYLFNIFGKLGQKLSGDIQTIKAPFWFAALVLGVVSKLCILCADFFNLTIQWKHWWLLPLYLTIYAILLFNYGGKKYERRFKEFDVSLSKYQKRFLVFVYLGVHVLSFLFILI